MFHKPEAQAKVDRESPSLALLACVSRERNEPVRSSANRSHLEIDQTRRIGPPRVTWMIAETDAVGWVCCSAWLSAQRSANNLLFGLISKPVMPDRTMASFRRAEM